MTRPGLIHDLLAATAAPRRLAETSVKKGERTNEVLR